MENATDALKMSFAVFVFIIALSIVFSLISQAKETADAVLFYSDKTSKYYEKYYDWVTGNLEERKNSRRRHSNSFFI